MILVEIKGEFKNVIYHNDSSFFTVARFVDEDTMESITVSGNFVELQKDITYKLQGDYVEHPKYGFQFNCLSYQKILPSDYDSQIAFLASPIFPGIGEKLATLIVDTLGEGVFERINEDPTCLDSIKGVTTKKKAAIVEGLRNNGDLEELIGFFSVAGIGMRTILKLKAQYGDEVMNITNANPYQFAEEVDGFGFASSEKIANHINFDMHSFERSRAALICLVMDECFKRGDSYLPVDELENLLMKRLGHNDFNMEKLLDSVQNSEMLYVEEDRIYHHSQYKAEIEVAKYFAGFLTDQDLTISEKKIERYIEETEVGNGITYDETQRQAIDTFIRKSFMILTGGPGTGKTTIVKGMIDLYKKVYPNRAIAICAPTGRAAKRLSELTGCEATTIHRMLKWNIESNEFAMDEDNPLPYELLVIDEFSMVDPYLLAQVCKAGRNFTKILFIGDEDQLPSVSPGATLRDFMECNLFPIVRLTNIYRQSEGSDVVKIAHDIKMNCFEGVDGLNDVKLYNSDPYNARKLVSQIIGFAIDKGYDMSQIQVLAPKYAGTNGIDALNSDIQALFNPPSEEKKELKIGHKVFREGDKILQLKNQMDDDVYNGDIGILMEIIHKNESTDNMEKVLVNYDGNVVTYSGDTLINITHAYCISIHKSQGSEYNIVIMPILKEYYGMLSKKLIYTGITRAKNALMFVGSPETLKNGLSIYERERKTTLKERLIKCSQMDVFTPFE